MAVIHYYTANEILIMSIVKDTECHRLRLLEGAYQLFQQNRIGECGHKPVSRAEMRGFRRCVTFSLLDVLTHQSGKGRSVPRSWERAAST